MAKKRQMKVDFTGVETFNIPAEGRQRVKIMKVEEATSQGGNDVLKFTFEVIAGKSKGCRVIESFSLADNALWKLKQLLTAIGMKCDKKVTIDLDKLIGKVLEIDVKYDEYQGTTRAKCGAFFVDSSDDEDEDEDEDDDEDEDFDDEDDDEPERDRVAPKSKPKKSAKPSKKSKPVDDDEDDDEFDGFEDEDEDEDEKPVKPKKSEKKTSKPSKKSKKAVEDDGDEDDDWENWEND